MCSSLLQISVADFRIILSLLQYHVDDAVEEFERAAVPKVVEPLSAEPVVNRESDPQQRDAVFS